MGQSYAGPQSSRIYFVRCLATNYIKIGYARDSIEDRFRCLQSGSGASLVLIGAIPGTREFERELHRRFSEHRVHGEWFAPNLPLFLYICRNVPAYPLSATRPVLANAREFEATLERCGVTYHQWLNDLESGAIPWCPPVPLMDHPQIYGTPPATES